MVLLKFARFISVQMPESVFLLIFSTKFKTFSLETTKIVYVLIEIRVLSKIDKQCNSPKSNY